MESKVDLILHPVRIRIIQILFGREMTTEEIATSIPDVPHAPSIGTSSCSCRGILFPSSPKTAYAVPSSECTPSRPTEPQSPRKISVISTEMITCGCSRPTSRP